MDIVRVEFFDEIEGYQTQRLTVHDMALLLGYKDAGDSERVINGFRVIDGGRASAPYLPAQSNSQRKSATRRHFKLFTSIAVSQERDDSDDALAS